MKTKIVFLILLSVLFILASKISANEQVTEDQWSDLQVFCSAIGFTNINTCFKSKIIRKLPCTDIIPVPISWQNDLKPQTPMALCSYPRDMIDGIKHEGCMIPVPFALLIVKNKTLITLKTPEEFTKEFFPINDKLEATTFASIITETKPMYKFPQNYSQLDSKSKGIWLVKNPTPSTAELKKDGWHVILYYEPYCGCHNLELYQVQYLINNTGKIKKLNEKKVWKSEDQICAD